MQTSNGCKISRCACRTSGRRRRRKTALLKRSSGWSCNDVAVDGRRKRIGREATAERLRTLRSLIPAKEMEAMEVGEATEADRLFEETADYILLLRTQVEVLQRLVDFYSPCAQAH